MELILQGVAQRVGGEVHLHPIELAPVPGSLTVLLGATRAGKTTLMRVMAGLDQPSAGKVLVDGQDVTGVPVRERNVAMVYQQFINYPSLTVFDNIASPLRLRGVGRGEIEQRVNQLAERLHIVPFLGRLPAELSGGQQQRVALARALAKQAPLMLLDEPLVNLDYKLREALREELAQLFAQGDATVIYATTEPGEALLLGGHTAVLDRGELLQYGPTAEVWHRPASIRVARAFSDPPMNLIDDGPARLAAAGLDAARVDAVSGSTLGVRAGALRLVGRPGDLAIEGQVQLAEIAGSDTFVHARTRLGDLVAQLPGVQTLELGRPVTLHLDPGAMHVFDAQGGLVRAPARAGQGAH